MRSPNATAGKLRDVIAWESPARSDGGTGQRVVAWDDAGTQRCHVEAAGGTERMYADAPLPQHSHRVTVRARTLDIRHDWRGKWTPKGGVERTLDVVTVLPADTGEDWLWVLCQEHAPTTEDA
jgi:head-tail adaptor